MKTFPTKKKQIQQLSGASDQDVIIGEIYLADLPEPALKKIINAHNTEVDYVRKRTPEHMTHFLYRSEELLIPTYEQFIAILADKERKHDVAPYLRKVCFENYKTWLKVDHPFVWENFLTLQFPIAIPQKERAKHSYVIGETGSGKSELLKLLCIFGKLIDGGINKNRSVVLIDPGGNLSKQLSRQQFFYDDFCRNRNDFDLIYIDPSLSGPEFTHSPVINPFDIGKKRLNDTQISILVDQLTGVFVSILGDSTTSLSLQMKTLLDPCLTVLVKRPGSTFHDLARFMNNDTNKDLVELGKNSSYEAHRTFFYHFFHTGTYSQTKSSIATKALSLLNRKVFADIIARPHSTIDIAEAVESGKTIIVNCAKGVIGPETSETIGRLVIALIKSAALSRAQIEKPRTPIDLIVDECHNFISPDIDEILTESRKYGLHITLAQQVVGFNMPEELTKIVLGNTSVKIFGVGGTSSQKKMCREMKVSHDDMAKNLNVGRFVVKAGQNTAMKVRIRSDYIDYKNTVSEEKWNELRTAMLTKYYHPADGYTAPKEQMSSLSEEIHVAGISGVSITQTQIKTPDKPEKPKPKFEDRNDFDDIME